MIIIYTLIAGMAGVMFWQPWMSDNYRGTYGISLSNQKSSSEIKKEHFIYQITGLIEKGRYDVASERILACRKYSEKELPIDMWIDMLDKAKKLSENSIEKLIEKLEK